MELHSLRKILKMNFGGSYEKKIPEFAYKVLGLYEAVQAGVVTQQELIDLLKEYGINMKEGENNEYTKCKRKKS